MQFCIDMQCVWAGMRLPVRTAEQQRAAGHAPHSNAHKKRAVSLPFTPFLSLCALFCLFRKAQRPRRQTSARQMAHRPRLRVQRLHARNAHVYRLHLPCSARLYSIRYFYSSVKRHSRSVRRHSRSDPLNGRCAHRRSRTLAPRRGPSPPFRPQAPSRGQRFPGRARPGRPPSRTR